MERKCIFVMELKSARKQYVCNYEMERSSSRSARAAVWLVILMNLNIVSRYPARLHFCNAAHTDLKLLTEQFSQAEIHAFVDEAARSERIVAAHCHGKAGIMAALRAGVHTIEHGTYLDDDCIEMMIEKKAILVATRLIQETGLKLSLNESSSKKMRDVAPVHMLAYQKAVKAGVKIALGSDLGLSIPGSIAAHGKNAQEIQYAVDAGLTPLQAIEATTATAPQTLGPQAPLSGQLKEGYNADFIAISRNPLEDIGVLPDPAHITHVWRGGRLYKSPKSPIISNLLL